MSLARQVGCSGLPRDRSTDTPHPNPSRVIKTPVRSAIYAAWALATMYVLVLPAPSHAADVPRLCLVVGVSDGDTITARCGVVGAYEQVKVRVGAIDAPEKAQPFGHRAKETLSDLVFGKEVALECFKTDRYGRSVCKVVVPMPPAGATAQRLDAGLAMVRQGMAWWYRTYAREQSPAYAALYCDAASTGAAVEPQRADPGSGCWLSGGPATGVAGGRGDDLGRAQLASIGPVRQAGPSVAYPRRAPGPATPVTGGPPL